jgi:hypothetical protein
MGGDLSGDLAADVAVLFRTTYYGKEINPSIEESQHRTKRGSRTMSRFCRRLAKVFDFGQRVKTVQDSRKKQGIPAAAIWLSAFFMSATRRGSLNGMNPNLIDLSPEVLHGMPEVESQPNAGYFLSNSFGTTAAHAFGNQSSTGS